jgi:hypothetical protein
LVSAATNELSASCQKRTEWVTLYLTIIDENGEEVLPDRKGNISKKRRARVYHVPGSRDYQKVVITPADGERYFCSEQDAVDCGWRKPGK